MLTRCRDHGITLNKEKFTVAAPSVSFFGYCLSADGISADEDKVRAIRDFPTPANLTDLHSFMSLVNQLADFTSAITAVAQPLRPLLSPKRSFTWTPDHDKAFADVKQDLSSLPVLAPSIPPCRWYCRRMRRAFTASGTLSSRTTARDTYVSSSVARGS
ncbi:uncharacterized protein LOC143020423 [Oratosquilla oratoria]|uniref:uncharacterized protein LOC143020423 n=1 Tax=Oratosquilla oratoria TaxID=337810 RepID=UPI003F762E7F